MIKNKFTTKLEKISKKNNSLVCVGLDPDIEKLPKFLLNKNDPIFEFNKAIIKATADLVCAYKPNIAFYESQGIKGLVSLKKTIEFLKTKYPEIPIILDAKRADIGNTSEQYAKAIFNWLQVDAVTIYPYLGYDSVEPFLKYQDKFIFFLIRTSNPDAKMVQDAKIGKIKFYLYLAHKVKKWPGNNFSVFCGATYPNELIQIRKIFPDCPILTAGIGAQGAKNKQAVKAGVNKERLNLICNASRTIIFAQSDKGFAQAARKTTYNLRQEINTYRNKIS